ncbi:hypothetical protein [Pedobacter nyackensis]|uniref:Uncharacterized protein n=1 Tax=Pedobacter nyackensis TaxID=475255 RepID=A0A1W2F2V6_9SPHI|nr:hypothetical protein [Pedobacter nyackensis]SMD16265.1 hypothetical protein SAMN04488101_11963 [Pedobacter nyackensis]
MKDEFVLLACGGLLVVIVALLPMILLWFNRNAIRTLGSNANQAMAANPTTPAAHNINTRKATIYTATFVTCTTILALVMFYDVHQTVTEKVKPITVNWLKTDSLKIKPGPVWFYYDSKLGTLSALHGITENDKALLIALVDSGDKNYYSFTRAIDKLTFLSNKSDDGNFYRWVILLYGIAGLIGVQLRTINNFVGVACFKNEFDFHRWWPWYLVRPLLGFITGAVVFLLIDGKQLLTGQLSGGISTVVLAVAFLGGFSADDFYELLRKISKRVFGAP